MTPSLTDAMVESMDDTADFMHQRPQFPTVDSAQGIKHARPAKLYTQRGLVTPSSIGISIPTREQGQADMHRRDAIKRGGI